MVLTVNNSTAIKTLSAGDLVAAGLFFLHSKNKTKQNNANEMAWKCELTATVLCFQHSIQSDRVSSVCNGTAIIVLSLFGKTQNILSRLKKSQVCEEATFENAFL